MKLELKVYPRSSYEAVKETSPIWKVYVREIATDGKANEALKRLLGRYFHLPKSSIVILRGEKSRNKLVSIEARS